MSKPSWLINAEKYIGQKEIAGSKHNPFILQLWTLIRAPFTDDETPWCAGFVGGVLRLSGLKSTYSAAARSYEKWGIALNKPCKGCIVVFYRGNPKGATGHVGFVVDVDIYGNLYVLGGNQSDMVCVSVFNPARVLCFRWPADTKEKPVALVPIQPRKHKGFSQNEQ